MKLIDKNEKLLIIEISQREFNLIRELESAIQISCSKDEIPTLTGWTKDELLAFGTLLSDIAEKHNINL
ncbi:hypothetical protein [Hafnia alvei]|uniref:hypothetical protein n=1 Tax=Hafnia alvei TaxID=569 RepID=UPI0024A92BBE|nr:hypothetical protein [Hafnia alvei]